MEHSTVHRTADGETREVRRQFHPTQVDAGYAEKEWGEHSTPDHELLGTYETSLSTERFFRLGNGEDAEVIVRRVPITVTVRHLEEGPTGGPEFELAWSDGMKVTVLDADTAVEYLKDAGAAEVVPDAADDSA